MIGAGLLAAQNYAAAAQASVRARLESATIDSQQRIVHGLAWIETSIQALRALSVLASRHSGVGEQLVLQIAYGETLAQLAGGLPMGQNEYIRPADFGLPEHAEMLAPFASGNTAANRLALIDFIRAGGTISDSLDDDALNQVRHQYRRFTDDRIVPHAHRWHLANALYFVPQLGNATVTASRYTVFADLAVTGEVLPTELPLFVGFNSPATAFAGLTNLTAAAADGPNSLQVTPAPQNASPMFGWGLIAALVTTADDLTNFQVAGRLNFSVRSTYPGKVQVGFLTGSAATSTAVQAYVVIDPSAAQYGYVNDGAWHDVSIPISAIVANATPAYGQPASARLNMAQVTQPFTIADLYASTGKTSSVLGAGDRTTFFIDNIYWSK